MTSSKGLRSSDQWEKKRSLLWTLPVPRRLEWKTNGLFNTDLDLMSDINSKTDSYSWDLEDFLISGNFNNIFDNPVESSDQMQQVAADSIIKKEPVELQQEILSTIEQLSVDITVPMDITLPLDPVVNASSLAQGTISPSLSSVTNTPSGSTLAAIPPEDSLAIAPPEASLTNIPLAVAPFETPLAVAPLEDSLAVALFESTLVVPPSETPIEAPLSIAFLEDPLAVAPFETALVVPPSNTAIEAPLAIAPLEDPLAVAPFETTLVVPPSETAIEASLAVVPPEAPLSVIRSDGPIDAIEHPLQQIPTKCQFNWADANKSFAEKYHERRQKNNLASRRSREKRKSKNQNILTEIEELTLHKEKLKSKVRILEEAIDQVKANLFASFAAKKSS